MDLGSESPVYADAHAVTANRILPTRNQSSHHTSYDGTVESEFLKRREIGIGKARCEDGQRVV